MNSIFNKTTREELLKRISLLNENSKAQWGKMDVSQMVKHCSKWDEMALGKTAHKQSFLGKLFGKFGLKDMMKDGPIKKNLPTVPSFVIRQKLDLEKEKKKWISLLAEYEEYSNDGFVHPFFGKLTNEQAGVIAYKHVDHHLRQFGV